MTSERPKERDRRFEFESLSGCSLCLEKTSENNVWTELTDKLLDTEGLNYMPHFSPLCCLRRGPNIQGAVTELYPGLGSFLTAPSPQSYFLFDPHSPLKVPLQKRNNPITSTGLCVYRLNCQPDSMSVCVCVCVVLVFGAQTASPRTHCEELSLDSPARNEPQ